MRVELNSREKFITHGRHMRVELLPHKKVQSSWAGHGIRTKSHKKFIANGRHMRLELH